MTDIDAARRILHQARTVLADDPDRLDELDDCIDRLDRPVRIALAGSLKAGKSTLLNALVGQDIAPTDATECTRVVTWYRAGRTASVTAQVSDGSIRSIPLSRTNGRLGFDFGDLTAEQVNHLDVAWPARALHSMTIVDTPGTASLSTALSATTEATLAPEDGRSEVDAVVYLMRSMTAADTSMLRRIGAAMGGGSGPLGVIGVVSRADEIGAGRMDAMISAEQVAGRFAGELERTGLCQAVVPVAGLLALAARTLREVEFRALTDLAALPVADVESALLSVDRFSRPDVLPQIDPTLRRSLVERFGVFGIRMSLTLIRFGTSTSSDLAAELVERSGLAALIDTIDSRFAQRAEQLKAHSALVAADHLLRTPVPPGAEADAASLRSQIRRTLADVHGFRELQLLSIIRGGGVALTPDELTELDRLIGGQGMDARTRLGLDPQADDLVIRQAAGDAARTWRSRAAHPLADAAVVSACKVGARSAEGIVAQLDSAAVAGAGPSVERR